jgi:acetyl esterase/lipase
MTNQITLHESPIDEIPVPLAFFTQFSSTISLREIINMKKAFTIISILSAILSVFPFLRSKNRDITVFLWLPKLLAGAFALWLALVGVVSVLYGWMRRDYKLAQIGSLGAALSLLHIRRVTRQHDGFERAFGAGWKQHIPASQQKRIQHLRWPILAVPPNQIPHQRDVVFGTSPATGKGLLADLWLPPKRTASTGLGAIYIHGGAWRLGAKDMGTRPFFQRLASLGYVVMDIDYTLWPDSAMTDMVREVKLAVAWLKDNSKALGLNPDRIVLMGGSAGGHLALLSGYTPDHPALKPACIETDLSVRGVVAFYPPVDFRNLPSDMITYSKHTTSPFQRRLRDRIISLMNNVLRVAASLRGDPTQPKRDKDQTSLFSDPAGFLSHLIGGKPDEIPETYALLSPTAHVGPHCPPTLLIQGTDDFFQLLPGVQRLYHRLEAAGVATVLVEFPHCEHAFDLILPHISPAAQAATQDVENFLALMAT